MTVNATPDGNGDVCPNGHVMHNLLNNGMKIEYVDEIALYCLLHYPEQFSLAPRTHMVNGFEVPSPESEEPEGEYFIPDIDHVSYCYAGVWSDHRLDEMRLERGLIHLTDEAAIANAKAMLGIDPSKD